MTEAIDQIMWGFQNLFRWHVEYDTKRVLEEIGIPVAEPQVLLVGIATEESAMHSICIEPDTGPLGAEHLAQVTDRADELYGLDPETQVLHSHPRARELRNRHLFHSARADAIKEAIETSAVFGGLTFFVSQSSPINGYEVHTCIGIPIDVIGNLPAFKEATVDRFHAGKSLQHEVIRECLYRADKALYLPDPGASFENVMGRVGDIITSATERFMRGTMWRTAQEPSDLFSALNAIASQTYERDGAKGNLTVTSRENLERWLTVRFKSPVRLRESRTMRKLLQLSDPSMSMSVLADPVRAYGLGMSKPAQDVVEVSITGHAEWEASVNGDKFVRVAYGNATIPNQPIEYEELEDIANRIIGDPNIRRIWDTVQAARESGHGATIVVSKDPATETARLSGQGMPVDPDYLEPKQIARLASVDGAVIIGPDGRCHAFGVILDGIANENGDRARGARFNSAVRYQNMEETPNSMIIVISDDGMIDMLPRLMPRVRSKEVAEVVDDFYQCCDSAPVDAEEFARLYERVKLYAFYLNDEQCRTVNEKHEREMDLRLASGGTKFETEKLEPNPQMNESYFWNPQSSLA